MAIIGQAGIFGFGPSAGKGIAVADENWFRHKATNITLGVNDDVRNFPAEVGGRPIPAGVYKGGYTVGGGADFFPRLENSIGWILYGTLGHLKETVPAVNFDGVLDKTLLTTSSQSITTGITAPPTSRKLCVRVWKGDSVTFTGSVSIVGTATEAFDFNTANSLGTGQRVVGIADRETIVGNSAMSSITSITLPAYSGAATNDIYVSVGWEEPTAKSHVFTLDDDNPSCIPYMGFRKMIPTGCAEGEYNLGETYNDCRIVSTVFGFPNDGLITCRLATLGTDYLMEEDPSWGTVNGATGWASAGGFEDFESVPNGSQLAGYLKVPHFDSDDLPVLSATVGWANTPGDIRMDRVYGKPYLDDVTIIGRGLTYQMNVKWKDPSLYRALSTGSKTGTVWSADPFTARFDVSAFAPTLMANSSIPAGLRIEAREVSMVMDGVVALLPNDSVVLRFTGSALDITGYDYVRVTLDNEISSYTWPTSSASV